MRLIATIIFLITLLACQSAATLSDEEKATVAKEVRQMLISYDDDIRKNGLPAEFKYLDNSSDFFWVPPGFTNPLSFDSVADIIKQNAGLFILVDNKWDTLTIYPLTSELATFTGRITSTLTPVTGSLINTTLMETGTAIKRKDGWKLLNGQTSIINNYDFY
jgi:hypothetical protein